MFKVFSAGLMCLGLATLGVTMSRGEVGVETPEPKKGIIIGLGTNSEAGLTGEVSFDLVATSEDGIQTADNKPGSSAADVGVSFTTGSAVEFVESQSSDVKEDIIVGTAGEMIDASTRETLEKLVKQLHVEAAKLRETGREEEAAQKLRTAAALEAVMAGKGAFPIVRYQAKVNPRVRTFSAPMRQPAAQAEFQARLAELEVKRARVQEEKPDSPEIAKLEKAILEMRKNLEGRNHFYFQEKSVAPRDTFVADVNFRSPPLTEHRRIVMLTGKEGVALKQKSEALLQAAKQLKEAGLDDKSRELSEQGEKLRAEAEKMQAHFEFGLAHPGLPPVELHQSLQELREQVQLLRKEVAELRGLLEKKQVPESTIAPTR